MGCVLGQPKLVVRFCSMSKLSSKIIIISLSIISIILGNVLISLFYPLEFENQTIYGYSFILLGCSTFVWKAIEINKEPHLKLKYKIGIIIILVSVSSLPGIFVHIDRKKCFLTNNFLLHQE